VKAAPIVIGSVNLLGLSKDSFEDDSQISFQDVIAAHVGAVCTHGDGTCNAGDVDIMDIDAVERRERGVRIKFVVSVQSLAMATDAATALSSYLHSPQFTTDLHDAGHSLVDVTSVEVDSEPTARNEGPPPEWKPRDFGPGTSNTSGKDALVVALCLISALFLCFCVIAAVYLVKRDKPSNDQAESDLARIYNASGDDSMFAIPTAEVIGVSEPQWSTVSTTDVEMEGPPTYREDERSELTKMEDARL